MQEHAAKFSEPNASRDVIEQAGEQLILALYGQMTCETLDELRYGMFLKSTVKNAFNLARLPPTTDAAVFHSMRTYHQVQAWLGRVTVSYTHLDVYKRQAIESERSIDRQPRLSSGEVLSTVGIPELNTYHKTENVGLNTIIIKDLNLNDPLNLKVTLSGCEILWLYGKWMKCDVPGWSGFMEEVTNELPSVRSKILGLPFLNYPPTLYDTIYTSLLTASKRCVEHGQKTCIVTFDQPLYYKAQDILNSGDGDLKNVIVRLGGFHLFMSFMGAYLSLIHI